jgi:hypothetical protein
MRAKDPFSQLKLASASIAGILNQFSLGSERG